MSGHGSWTVFAVLREPETCEDLKEAIAETKGARLDVRISALKDLSVRDIHARSPDILLIEVDVEDPDDMAALHLLKLDSAVTQTPILVTAQDLTPSGMRRLLRDGVDDFLPQPLNRADLQEAFQAAIERIRQRRSSRGATGRILTFAKAAGGMGATTLAVNAAYSLMQRKKGQAVSVCLIDLDLQFGRVALYLDLEATPGMIEIVRAPERLDLDLLRGSTVQHKSGLHVLTAPSTMMPLEALKPELMTQLLDYARQAYDYVVIDLPQALASWSETVFAQSDLLYLVTQLNVPAVRQTKRYLDILHDEGMYALPIKLVLNRHRSSLGWSGQVPIRQAEKALGRAIDHFVPNDFHLVLAALNQGIPAFAVKPRSRFCRKVRAMAESAADELDRAAKAEAVPASAA